MRRVLILVVGIGIFGCAAEANPPVPVARATNQNQIGGTVLETLDVSSYTYVRFESAAGEAWAAIPREQLEVGSQIVLANPQAMKNFESKSLKRTFETIYFATLEGRQDHAPGASGGVLPSASDPVDSADLRVEKADGATGRTVAELYADKGELAGTVVAIRGKVVKYTPGIMGRNWIHLQDGSGDADAGTHDVTVTSNDMTAVGEIVLVEGTVAVDKDFGAGYRYGLIVEEARVQ